LRTATHSPDVLHRQNRQAACPFFGTLIEFYPHRLKLSAKRVKRHFSFQQMANR
jgi:hypothetical protein